MRTQRITHLVELAPAHQTGHFVAGLELLKADDAFGVVAVFIHTVLFCGHVGEHAAGGVAVAERRAFSRACAAHATSAGGGQASRGLGVWAGSSGWGGRSRVEGDAFLDVLGSCRIVCIRCIGGQLASTDGALVLLCNLASGSRVQLLDGRWLWRYVEGARKHVASSCRA